MKRFQQHKVLKKKKELSIHFTYEILKEFSKQLSAVTRTVKHNYITSIITMRVLTTTCFGPTCGPSSGCNYTRSVILECVEHSWGVGGRGVTWSRF